MRIAIVVVIALHAAIHVLGFVKGLGLAEVAQLSQPISRPVGVAWLGAGLALLLSAVLFGARVPLWWGVAVVAALGSQALIMGAWSDAKFGTIANVIVLALALGAAAEQRFVGQANRITDELLAGAEDPRPISAEALATLPPVVRAWLERSGAAQTPAPRVIRLRQRGEMQLAPGQGFRGVEATQHFRSEPPAFSWQVGLTMFGVPIVGQDTWIGGRGRMHITLSGLVPVVDAADERIDQGALLRYLGETVWFPAAALSPHITWAQKGEQSAEATLRYGDVAASALFQFDAEGRFSSLSADRYFGGGPDAQLRPWTVRATSWARVPSAGVEIPDRGEVVWQLPEGEFVFYRFAITAIDYDAADAFPPP